MTLRRIFYVVIATAALAASLFIFFGQKEDSTPISVEVHTLREQTVYESFVCKGTAQAEICQSVVLGRPAVITEVFVSEGESVVEGQRLFSCRYLEGEELLQVYLGSFYAELMQRVDDIRYELGDKALLASAVYGGELPSYLKDYYMPQPSTEEYRQDVFATADGVVSDIFVSEGETVSGAFSSLILSRDELTISINVPQRYFSKIEVGRPVNVSADSLGDTVVAGNISAVGSKAVTVGGILSDSETVIPCRVSFDNSLGLVGENYAVSARVFCREFIDVLVIPYEAVFQEDGVEYVFVFFDGSVQKRRVNAVFETESGIISQTVSSGEQVVMNPSRSLFDGARAEAEG